MVRKHSPFPGMDPYLEPHWQGVHVALIVEMHRALNRLLPNDLAARMEERIAIESSPELERLVNPDVFGYQPGSSSSMDADTAVSVDAPYCLLVDIDPVKQRFIRIVSQDSQLITVVEFISPSNKVGEDADDYLKKRSELLAAGTHMVEIDLVRQGSWRALMKPHVCPASAVSTFRVTVRTAGLPRRAYVYPIPLQTPLPEIQIPLRPQDSKLMLPLQPMIEAIYSDGRYGMTLDYTRPLDPPLSADDQRYATDLLSASR